MSGGKFEASRNVLKRNATDVIDIQKFALGNLGKSPALNNEVKMNGLNRMSLEPIKLTDNIPKTSESPKMVR